MLTRAYVNHGRWCVDCPQCNTGWLADSATPLLLLDAKGVRHAQCYCGAGIAAQFPPDKDAIDAQLGNRPEANRNWRPGESVIDLRIENAAHGVVA